MPEFVDRMSTQRLSGQVCLITGGGTGIGRGITKLFEKHGATVVVCQPDAASAATAEAWFADTGLAVEVVSHDLAEPAECAALIRGVLDRFGRIDVLINNAATTGPASGAPFLEVDDALLDKTIAVNLAAVFRLSRDAARSMVARGEGGVILSISSVGAFAAQMDASAYVATKAAVVGLVKSMAFELGPHGIRCAAIAPGDIDTSPKKGPSNVGEDLALPAERTPWQRATPLGRRGTPDDVAQLALFLASPEASFITGTTILVDGGWLTY